MIGGRVTTPVPLDKFEKAIEKACQVGLRNLAESAFRFWKDEAGRTFHQTLRDYRQALDMKKVDQETYEITLHHSDSRTNFLVIALETGYPSFDLKPGLLKSRSADRFSAFHKTNPGGIKSKKYVDVPFRTATRGGQLVKTQGKPNKWRRVHPGSGGWMHPGFKARNLREKVTEHIQKQAEKTLLPLIARISI